MMETREWKKQNDDSTGPLKVRHESKPTLNPCGGCNACHQMTRIHSTDGITAWAGEGGEGIGVQKTCAANFFQRNLGNSFLQSHAENKQSLGHTISQGGVTSTIQRKCSCGGSCESCSDEEQKLGRIQTKLTVGAANDTYEQEADRVAEQIVRMPAIPLHAASEQSYNQLSIQRVSAVGGSSGGAGIEADIDQNGGEPLSSSTREFMEPRFGIDFGHVRLHKDEKAHRTARQIQARAFTYGSQICLGEGESEQNSSLMAHELTHVVQQRCSVSPSPIQSANVKDQSVALEIAEMQRPVRVQRLGANPACTKPEADSIHQAIYDARGWLNKAISQLSASPPSPRVLSSLRANFGPTYGVAANIPLILARLQRGFDEISTIPMSCTAADPICAAGSCGFAVPGSHKATICTNVTFAAGIDSRYKAGCVLHESFHAAYSNFHVDQYSGWYGSSGSTGTYPGTGTDPLLNADSYTKLAMDLS